MPVLFAGPAVVSGASGFVGSMLCSGLGSARALHMATPDWREEAARVSFRDATVFHLAARVHGAGGDADYVSDNVEKTRWLAEHAANAGARTFIFLSSIKVNGEASGPGPFTEADPPDPQDAYARSKLDAERALERIAEGSGMRVVIVRPPLVYGAGARGNLAALLRLADSSWPLPFGALDQPRSFVHVGDLCELLQKCASHEAARGIYLAAHREPVTTARLVTLVRRELGRAPRLFSVNRGLLTGLAGMAGKRELAERLSRPLVADPALAQRQLGWIARRGIEECVLDLVRGHRGAAS
jgi:nucleoside-diphosphate-sugar epimerase